MDSTHAHRGAPSTAVLLRDLLAEHEPYRRLWRRHVQRAGTGAIHQGAVAAVLASYLWDSGEVDEADLRLPRRLKDPVARALSGQALSRRTLDWFIAAFEMVPAHQDQLWDRWQEDQEGPFRPPVPGHQEHGPVPEEAFQTETLDEYHVLGPDGIPKEHTTVQVVRARRPLSRYTYRFDTSAASITVVRGGRAGHVYPDEELPGIYAADIHFPVGLATGQTTILEYVTTFRYEQAPPPEVRRGVSRLSGSIAMQVRFHPQRLPDRVWWATWTGLAEPPASREETTLRPDGSAHRFLSRASAPIVGFVWDWDDPGTGAPGSPG